MRPIVETEMKVEGGVKKKYVGRFLGFITNEEYLKTIGNPEISSRIETKPTKDLLKCCEKANEKNWGLSGARFVIVIRKIDDRPTLKKILLISDRLNFVSQIKPDAKEVMFATMKNDSIVLKEREATIE